MIRHSSKISCGGSNINLCSRSEGSGESAHLHRLALAFVTVSESHMHARLAVCVSFMRAAKNIHKAAQVHLSLLSLDNLRTLNNNATFSLRPKNHIVHER